MDATTTSPAIDARKLRAALALRGLREYQAAAAVPLSPPLLSGVLSGRRPPRPRLREKLEAVLHLAPGALAPDDGRPSP